MGIMALASSTNKKPNWVGALFSNLVAEEEGLATLIPFRGDAN